MSRTGPGHPQGSCSRETGSGLNLHKGLKEASIDRGVVSSAKDKDRQSSKQESKDRHPHSHHPQPQHHHPHQPQHHPQHSISMEDVNGRALERHKASVLMEYKDHSQSMNKPLSACLLNGKMQIVDSGAGNGVGAGAGSKGSMASCGGEGMVRGAGGTANAQARHMGNSNTGRCTKEAASGEMRISEQPASDCLERGQTLHQSLTYSVPPPLSMGSAPGGGHPGGFHCLQLHPSHPHHPHHTHHPHHSHHSHHHPDFFCPPPPAPIANPSSHEKGIGSGGAREPKVTGPTFVPSVGHLGDKVGGPFQLGNPECQGVGGGGNGSKDKAIEKASGGGGHPGNWHRKQQEQQQQQQPPPQKQHPYRKAEKAPDWMHNSHHHLQQQQQSHAQQHQAVRSRSADCINSMDPDVYRPALAQEPKTGHPLTHPSNINSQTYRDCSHTGPPPNSSPLAGKTMAQQAPGGGGGSCSMQREGQKVARIRHQQHGRTASDGSSSELNQTSGSQEMKRKMDMSPYGYNNSGQHHSHQQPPVPTWAMHPHHVHPEEDQRKAYMESVSGATNGRQQPQLHQSARMGPPPTLPALPAPAQTQQEALGSQGEGNAMKNLLKYSNQQQPLLLSQKSPFGGLGNLKTGPNGTNCTLQTSKSALPSRKGPTNESERPDCGGRSRDMGEAPHLEGEVRQPPIGIAVAVARQREPTCRPPDNHPSSRQGRVHSTMKGKHEL